MRAATLVAVQAVTAGLAGLALLFVAAFLVRVPSRSRGKVKIAVPPAALWEFLTDPRHIPQWNSSVTDLELDSGPPLHVGAVYRYTVVAGRRRIPCRATVSEWDPPRAIRSDVLIGLIQSRAGYRLEPAGAGTLLHASTESRVPLLQAAAWTILGRRWFGAGLERLRDAAERDRLSISPSDT